MFLSIPAFIIVAAILFPNLLFIIFPPRDTPPALPASPKWIDALEQGGRILFILIFILYPDSGKTGYSLLLLCMILTAVSYYVLWIRYIVKGRRFQSLFEPVLSLPIPMAIFPLLSFTFGCLWLEKWIAFIPLACFAFGHTVNSLQSAKAIDL